MGSYVIQTTPNKRTCVVHFALFYFHVICWHASWARQTLGSQLVPRQTPVNRISACIHVCFSFLSFLPDRLMVRLHSAPALGSRSPPKTPAPAQETDENDSALSRFARAKQQATQDFSDRPGGPKIITSPPKPERWSVKDTSVNIATAFTQAAATMSTTSTSYTHNNAWASTSRATMPVPRSTSVEYEAAAPQAANRRLPGPPDKFNRPATTATRKPLSKTPSFRHVPDSEGEEDRSATTNIVRGKSPFEHGLSFARTALTNAAYYVRQRSREPEDQSLEHPHPSVNGSANGNESSYDYAEEEQAFQAQKRNAALKRNRMSKDNKAYKPSQESEDESEWSDDGKTRRRRRKFKKGPAGGPLSSLPVVTADKRRRKKSRGNLLDADEDDSGSDGNRQVDTVCPLFPLATFQLTRSVSPYTRLSHYKIRMRHLHDQLTTSHRTTLTTPCYQPNKASNQYQKWRKSFF